jgi:hypothetical protein
MGELVDAYQEAIQHGNDDAYEALAGALYEQNMGKDRAESIENTKRVMRAIISMSMQQMLVVAEAEVDRVREEVARVRADLDKVRNGEPQAG